jgi:four helix bundle protein
LGKAHQLVLKVYRFSNPFPKEEIYSSTSQLRRAALSIPTNIAERCGRGTDRELAHFIRIAMGLATEVEYLLLVSKDLNFLAAADYIPAASDIDEIQKMLTAFLRKLDTPHS